MKETRYTNLAASLAERFMDYIRRLHSDHRTRINTFSWTLVILFVGVSLISSSNPFRLMVPGLAYPRPVSDQREQVTLYGVERSTGRIIPMKRYLYRDDSTEQNVIRLAFALTESVGLRELEPESQYYNNAPLPELGFAIRKVWIRTRNGKRILVVDLRRDTLEEETVRFLKGRESSTRGRVFYLEGFFQVFTASLFHVEKNIQVIRYLLDGKPGSLRGVNYPLDRPILKGRVDEEETSLSLP